MAQVFLSLGSNIDRDKNIAQCLRSLHSLFGEVRASSVYESEPVGFDGSNFYNLVVSIHTQQPIVALAQSLRQIEDESGRDRRQGKFSSRSLDIDILTYDNLLGNFDGIELPRGEILYHAFVLQPLAELAPQAIHPGVRRSYAQLWQQFDRTQQALWVVPFDIGA